MADFEKRIENFDSILELVGREGSSRPKLENMHPQPVPANVEETTFPLEGIQHGFNEAPQALAERQRRERGEIPTLIDIQTVREDLYEDYRSKANGDYIVIFNPLSLSADEWGFCVQKVLCTTKRVNERRDATFKERPRLVVENEIEGEVCDYGKCEEYTIYGERANYVSLKGVDKMIEANEGEIFYGWKNIKQYKYTRQEIEELIGGQIFKYNFNPLARSNC